MPPAAPEPVIVPSPEVAVWRPWIGRGLRWLAFVVALAPFAIQMVGGGLLGIARPAGWPDIVAALLEVAAGSGLASLLFVSPLRKRAASVRADSGGIELTFANGAVRTIRNREVRQAAIVADARTPGVALDLSGGRSMSVRTRSVEEAQRLFAALGPGAKQARYRMQLRPSLLAAAGGCLSLAAVCGATIGFFNLIKQGMSGLLGGSLWLGVVVAILCLFHVFTSRPAVEVGADGVVIEELFRRRFVGFRELESIRAADGRVEMRFAGGRVERVRLSQVSREQVAALDDRLSRAHTAARGEGDGGRASRLARGGRPLQAWRAHLSELLARGEGYRDAALTREEAEAVLAAGDALPEHRVGAAIALVAADREHARERVRIAADGCANPRLRVALSELADGDVEDASVLEAIGEESAAPGAAPPHVSR